MKTYFADTYYFRALFDERDEHHARVLDWTKGKRFRLVTTEFVLAEVGDEFGKPRLREVFVRVFDGQRADTLVEIVEANSAWIERGVRRFARFRDKEWGLTDCISFEVMESEGVQEALTGDKHFEQAGFVALLKQ